MGSVSYATRSVLCLHDAQWSGETTSNLQRSLSDDQLTYTCPYTRVHEGGWMVQRGSGRRTDLLQEEAMNGCTVSGGPKSWPPVGFLFL
jgi:hypothetical protein